MKKKVLCLKAETQHFFNGFYIIIPLGFTNQMLSSRRWKC